jgi:hypothetical protein
MGSRSQRVALLAAVALAGCGGGGESAGQLEAPPAARVFALERFQPSGEVAGGKKTDVSFAIQQPSGKPLTTYAKGNGPHTGVHVMYVRSDLSAIIHRHPPVAADGEFDDEVTFKQPGRYRVVVDAYPAAAGVQKNFQLFNWLTVAGKATDKPLPAFRQRQKVDGYTVAIQGRPDLKAVTASLMTITVTDRDGKPAKFTPYYGALAHAIFFREGSLDYFHTHVCAPGTQGCTSTLGGAQVTGTASRPGTLQVGVLVPVAGRWRLFVQVRADGHLITAPFTLDVK